MRRGQALSGLPVVCYYGCLLTRPPKVTGEKNYEDPQEMEDAQVVQKVLRGHPELFGVILERYQRPIFNFIYRFYGHYDLSEDLTQETFLRCYQFLKSYDPKRKFSTWLYTVAKNLCIDHLKKQKSAREVALDKVLPVVERQVQRHVAVLDEVGHVDLEEPLIELLA